MEVRAYASTLFRPKPDDIKRACEYYLEKGFTAIKFGWGVFGQDRKLDIALVKAAREAVGDDVDLLVDAGWKQNRSAILMGLLLFRSKSKRNCMSLQKRR